MVTAWRMSDRKQPFHKVVSHDGLPVSLGAQIPWILAWFCAEDGKLALRLLISGRHGAMVTMRLLALGARSSRRPSKRVDDDVILV